MLQQLQNHAVRIVMGVAFFLFGFFVVANALDLADREIVIGLVAGFVGGLTMLAAVMRQQRALDYYSNSSVSSSKVA
jgi:fluoride ion exporter CrcB/FEX